MAVRGRWGWFLFGAGAALGVWGGGCADESPPSVAQVVAQEDAGAEPDAAEPDVAEPDTAEPDAAEPDAAELPPVIEAVETDLSLREAAAGDVVEVTCRFLDPAGDSVELPAPPPVQIGAAPGEALAVVEPGRSWRAIRAGEAAFTCAAPTLGLIDPTPATLTIRPGAPEVVVTTVDRELVVAGDEIDVGCAVYDAWGNPLPEVATRVSIEPSGAGVEVIDHRITLEPTGTYTVACQVDGASEVTPEIVEVLPALPARLALAKVPEQRVYAIGQVVGLAWTVTDRYGNVIPDASVSARVSPASPGFGEGRFRLEAEGTYILSARVTGRTENNIPLEAATTAIVNGAGPSIVCEGPGDGAFVDSAPSQGVTFTAKVADANGVASVQINGASVPVESSGRVTAQVPTRFGVNFVDVVATDPFGEENSRTCSFLVADQWAAEGGWLDDGVTLRLTQDAFDDRSRGDGLDSLDDILHAVLNSAGLVSTLRSTLEAADPLSPSTCHQRIFGACVLSSEVTHEDSTISGPNSSALTLVPDGLQAVATIQGLGVRVRVRGRVAGIPYDTTGWVRARSASVDVTFDTGLRNNRPRVTVRRLNSVSLGQVETEFNGLDGFIINVVVDLFQGPIRRVIEDALASYVQDSFDSLLDGVVGSLDVSSLGASFDVPRLDGGEPLRLGFGVRFSSVAVSAARARFGIGTRLTGPTLHAGSSLGAPLPPGPIAVDSTSPRTAVAGVHVGVLNQALHALWRGGLLDVTLTSAQLAGFPAGVRATLRTQLPPATIGRSGEVVEVSLGAMQLELVYPGLFDVPLAVTLGARAETGIELVGEELRFRDIQLTELRFSTPDISLSSQHRDAMEELLVAILQEVLDGALNSALPALPIPAFTTPDSLAPFGLPAGASMGVQSPSLSNTPSHFLLEGNFGVR